MRDGTVIYALIDPRNQDIRYVGKSAEHLVYKRYYQHYGCYGLNHHKNAWIKGLRKAGLRPSLFILE